LACGAGKAVENRATGQTTVVWRDDTWIRVMVLVGRAGLPAQALVEVEIRTVPIVSILCGFRVD
jgi:hypothetical protein